MYHVNILKKFHACLIQNLQSDLLSLVLRFMSVHLTKISYSLPTKILHKDTNLFSVTDDYFIHFHCWGCCSIPLPTVIVSNLRYWPITYRLLVHQMHNIRNESHRSFMTLKTEVPGHGKYWYDKNPQRYVLKHHAYFVALYLNLVMSLHNLRGNFSNGSLYGT